MRSLALLLIFSCAPRSAAVTAPAPEPAVASSAGTPVPWPPPTTVTSPGLRTQTRPLPHDIAQLRDLRGLTISRDGARIAYVVRAPTFDPKATPSPDDTKAGWKVEQQLFVVDRTGGASRQLTFGDDAVSDPKFSPDGQSIAFMRAKGGKPALQVMSLAGGEARAIPFGDYSSYGYVWMPDGKAIAFIAERPRTDDDKKARWQRGGANPVDRQWEQTHLFVIPLTGGDPRHVNRGTDSVTDFAVSPDGKRFAIVFAKSSEPVESGNYHRLAVIDAADGDHEVTLDQGDGKTPFSIRTMAWSPDSRQVAYSLTARGGLSHIDELRIRSLDKPTSVVDVGAKLDLEIETFVWAGDSRSVIANVLVRTGTKLYRLSLDGRAAREIPMGDRWATGLDADRSGRYLVSRTGTPMAPSNPTLIDAERGTITPLANLNPQVSEWTIAKTEIVTWKNRENVALDGVLTITGDPKSGPAPLVVLPHGGPDSVTQRRFTPWAQLFAARGYSVFEPNYRGGTAYGRAFYESNRGRFGEIEQMDIESGVDALVASGKADPARLFFAGWSWGGYISAWTLGHTDRYRAFMVGAGITDTIVQYVTSDINHGAAADWEFKGRPWGGTDTFDRANPARSLVNAKAPTLIIHGESDTRVPFVNGQILYRALADRGVPVTFWSYPREPHGFQEPAHYQHMLEIWAAFFDDHLK